MTVATTVKPYNEAYKSLRGWCIWWVRLGASLNSTEGQPLHCINLRKATDPAIPVIKEGVVDEFLQDSGEHISTAAKNSENSIISEFAVMNNPETRVFLDKMDDFIQIYNHTKTIYFDEKCVYLIA